MYTELECHSYYSLLGGASSPERLVERAAELKMEALALTDTNGLYAASNFYRLCKSKSIHPIIGAEIFVDGAPLILLCKDMEGYSRLSHLLTNSYRDRPKAEPKTTKEMVARLAGHWIALGEDGAFCDLFGRDFYLNLTCLGEQGGLLRCAERARSGLQCVVTGGVRYAYPEDGIAYDLLTSVRTNRSLDELEGVRPSNHCRYLRVPGEMKELFPEAFAASERIKEQCQVDLDFSSYRFPRFPLPEGEQSSSSYLRRLCLKKGEPSKRLNRELDLIERLDLSGYFLIVWDIVEFARRRGIPAQGRGSAANSLVAYLLGITPVDPIANGLFLGRFLNDEMSGVPDIDIDFANADREEVIQYIYDKYGADRVAMVCTYITFRRRSAVRAVGKALGVPKETIDQIVRRREYPDGWGHLEPLVERLLETPRHLSIHVGGMVIASRPLSDLVPLEPARMGGRIVCQWDKNFIEDAGLIKVDILGLGMLSAIRDATESIGGVEWDSFDDPNVYDLISRGDTVGLFQVESRAQMQSLPRTRPSNLSELAIQVAIIRPGPIQGNMVSPYIRRKAGLEPVAYLHPLLEPILEETLGVILFQEQVLQVAVALADFSEGEAEMLRKAMSRGKVGPFREKFFEGAALKGIDRKKAEEIFASLEGFAAYGFCKSHAHSFAATTYRSAWLKRYFPAHFLAALLNNQPMGFYQPEVLLEDARRSGVEILPVDLNQSEIRSVAKGKTVRLGLLEVSGLGEVAAKRISEGRPYRSLFDLLRRTDKRRAEHLIRAGALDSFGVARRHLLWQLWAWQDEPWGPRDAPILRHQSRWEEMVDDYRMMGHSSRGHPLAFLRESLQRQGWGSLRDLTRAPSGSTVKVAGMVVCRQRPPTAKGFLFLTLEDEFGLMNLVVSPDVAQRDRLLIADSPLLVAIGTKEEASGVINLKVSSLASLSPVCLPL